MGCHVINPQPQIGAVHARYEVTALRMDFAINRADVDFDIFDEADVLVSRGGMRMENMDTMFVKANANADIPSVRGRLIHAVHEVIAEHLGLATTVS